MKKSGDCLGWSVEMPGGGPWFCREDGDGSGRWVWSVFWPEREQRRGDALRFFFSKGKGRLAAVFGQEREMLGPGFVVVSWGRNGCGSKNPQSSRSGQGALVLSFSSHQCV